MNIKEINKDVYEVEDDGEIHYVIKVNGEWVCTCNEWWLNNSCKHIEEIEMRGKR